MGDSPSPWDVPSSWRPALDAARRGGVLMLLGSADSGKSTLAAVLANEALRAGREVAVVDGDLGQSSIGPPGCVGMARPRKPFASLEELEVEAIEFVGVSSPAGHMLDCVAATDAMAHAARDAGAETVVVDTMGMISGPVARALELALGRVLAPDSLIALQAEDEVEPLLAPFARRARPEVLRLAMSRRVKQRTREERASRRQRRLAAYFSGGRCAEVAWDEVPMENTGWTTGEPVAGHVLAYAEEQLGCEVLYGERRADGIVLIVDGRPDRDGLRSLGEGYGGTAWAIEVAALDRLLVGLLDARGRTLAMGLMEAVDFRRHRVTVFSPLPDLSAVCALRLGGMRVARDGTELGRNQPGALG